VTFSKNDTIAKVHFRANASITVTGESGASGYYPARLILTFEREKGEWKIIDVERLSPLNGQKMGSVLERSAG
jgi:hypothetical protein